MKKVKMQLIGLDGNAYAIMGRFSQAAKRAGWKERDIEMVLSQARSGDYDNLLRVMMQYTYDPHEDQREEQMRLDRDMEDQDPDEAPEVDDDDEY